MPSQGELPNQEKASYREGHGHVRLWPWSVSSFECRRGELSLLVGDMNSLEANEPKSVF